MAAFWCKEGLSGCSTKRSGDWSDLRLKLNLLRDR